MTPERWQRVKDVFDRAVDCGPASRPAFIRESCGDDEELRREVESLLDCDPETGTLLDAPAIVLQMAADPPRLEGTRIGPYEILRELGKGGMGFVYLARRADGVYPKPVALKVLRSDHASPDLLHRFEQERRILASLDHPNIARLFDGGKTPEGLPYYVMEFIEGQPIDRHCDLQHLDLSSRLRLFQQVCAAVDCAHRSGIVHRDLKPSNILVTRDGIAKLLDFGIAKLLQTGQGDATIWLTDAGLRPMTPEYASPEQIKEEELTRATDVYSLGVVLYEMLTGRRPYRMRSRVFHEILRVVCEEEPTLPSVSVNWSTAASGIGPSTDSDAIGRLRQTTAGDLRKQLSGDLDSIVMKALRKEPWQRYGSAAQFGEDVRRHLEGSPVEARSGRYYRLGKQLNRNRGWLLLTISLMAAVATGGIHVTRPAALIGAAALAMFAIWQAGANREVARRIAGGPVWGIFRAVGMLTFSVVLFFSMVGPSNIPEAIKQFNAGFIDGYGGQGYAKRHGEAPPIRAKALVEFHADPYWDWVLRLSWYVPVGLLFARWLGRTRWGGSLVLKASYGHNKWLGTVVVIMLASETVHASIYLWLVAKGRPIGDVGIAPGEIVYLLLLITLWALTGRCEFRHAGLITATSFYRWSNIASYGWSEDSRKDCAVLILKLHGRHPLLPTPKIVVPPLKKLEAEAVMTRFLSEWPGGTARQSSDGDRQDVSAASKKQ